MRCLIDIEAEVEVVFDVEQSNEPARAQSVHYDTVRSKYTSDLRAVFCFSVRQERTSKSIPISSSLLAFVSWDSEPQEIRD